MSQSIQLSFMPVLGDFLLLELLEDLLLEDLLLELLPDVPDIFSP